MTRIAKSVLRGTMALACAALALEAAPSCGAESLTPPTRSTSAPYSAEAHETANGFGAVTLSPLLRIAETVRGCPRPCGTGSPRAPANSNVPTNDLSQLFPLLLRFNSAPVAATADPTASAMASAEPRPAPPASDSRRRSAGGEADTATTNVADAVNKLILRDDRVNPLGSGDWRGARAAIGAFYAVRGFRPVWVEGDGLTPAGHSVLDRLARASDDGLSLGAFAPPLTPVRYSSPQALADAEIAIAAAVVIYAEQASGSRVSPTRVSRLISETPAVADPGAALAETAAAADPGKRLSDFNPPQKGYRDLRDALQRLSERDEGVARSESSLGPASDLLASNDDAESVARLAHPRIKRLAHRGRRTVVAAADSTDRERSTILANMEMWRWQPRDMGERRIEVNIPDFSVSVMDGDELVHRARVVVGKPTSPTPVFSDVMRYVVINPSWRVPQSIIKKEMMSKLDYLSSHGYEVKTVNGRVTVRQLPGERNALGRLAFMFPNDYAVYLHDTPSQDLFEADTRAFSHGCVRVEDPVRLAEIVLDWPEERITRAFGKKERAVYLPQPLPIHIEYFTAFVDEYGDFHERPDLYGLTGKVTNTLSSLRQD